MGEPGRRWATPLTATVSASVSASLFAALSAAVVRRGGAPFGVDADLHAWALAHRPASWAAAARLVTDTGSGVPALLLTAVAGAAAARRRWRGAGVYVLALLTGQGVRLAVAHGIGRARPPMTDWVASASGPSFPSGHTTTSGLVAGLACLTAARRLPGRRRAGVVAGALAWAGAVGLTRVYLGVHWPTDVAGGWLLAAALTAGLSRLVPRALAALDAAR